MNMHDKSLVDLQERLYRKDKAYTIINSLARSGKNFDIPTQNVHPSERVAPEQLAKYVFSIVDAIENESDARCK